MALPPGEWSGRDLSGETPPSLAELPALAEPEGRRGSDPVHQGVTASDGLTETEPGAVGCRESPTVLRLEGVGDARSSAPSLTLRPHPSTTRSKPSSSPLHPVVSTQFGFCARFLALRSAGPLQKYNAPSSQTPNSGVTCGRPSGTHRRQPVHLGALQVCERRGPLRRDRTIAAERAQVGYRLPLNHLASLPPSLIPAAVQARARPPNTVSPQRCPVSSSRENPSCAANFHPDGSNTDDGMVGHGDPGNPYRLPTSIRTPSTRSWRSNIVCR
jgi:hypothetical protein